MTDNASSVTFDFEPAGFIPFRDKDVLQRIRRITRDQIDKHKNPDYRITVMPDDDIEFVWTTDMFRRIKSASDSGDGCVLILPNPYPGYRHLARLINQFDVDCRKVWFFAMDEFANEQGQIAPDAWPQSLTGAMKRYLWLNIDDRLRPPASQVLGLTNDNIDAFGRMIEDAGGADCVYTGPGWTGHLCYVEPTAPEFAAESLEQWQRMGSRVVTLHPLSIAQQSLHGDFGMSGDVARVPPRGATIGPAEIIAAKNRVDMHAVTVHGTATAWQRFISRLSMHGPVTPRVPTSLHQILRTDVWVTETIAQDINDNFGKGY
jgi:6-phosphogluconolactonase/glucosamine-6-phosphate isomerase/deaminase